MKNEIEQGTIIYGVKSNKYPESKCYSIIISARCDVFNGKIDKVYCLTALDVGEWLCTKKGFDIVYYKDFLDRINQLLSGKKINASVLKDFSEDERNRLIFQFKEKDQEIKKRIYAAYGVSQTPIYNKIKEESDYSHSSLLCVIYKNYFLS